MFMDNFWWMSGFLSDSRFRLLAVSNSSLRFSDFPLTTMDDFFFSMWSQAEVKIWWIAFITSGGTAGIFCVKKEGKPFEWREISRIAHFVKITSEASWFLARKSKQPGVPTSFSQEKKSWKFVYILAKQCSFHFNLTNFFDKKFQNSIWDFH